MSVSHELRIGARLERGLLQSGGKICTSQIEALFPSWLCIEYFEMQPQQRHHLIFRSAHGLTPHATLVVSVSRITRNAEYYGFIQRVTFLSNARGRLLAATTERAAREIFDEALAGDSDCWPVVEDQFSTSPGRRPVEVH